MKSHKSAWNFTKKTGSWVYTMVLACVLFPYSTILRSLYLRIWVLSPHVPVLPGASAANPADSLRFFDLSGTWSLLAFSTPVNLLVFHFLIYMSILTLATSQRTCESSYWPWMRTYLKKKLIANITKLKYFCWCCCFEIGSLSAHLVGLVLTM